MQNPYQGTLDVYYDAFVTKLSSDGTKLIYSTYLGGRDYDYGYGIAVDSVGDAYLTGQTESWDFPTKNPYQEVYCSDVDAFVAKLSSDGESLKYSTYLGGDRLDIGYAIAVDRDGNAYITGTTKTSFGFPTQNPFQGTYGGNWDAFITKL
jgi:hypothetical protein